MQNILLMIETSRKYGRGCLQGIASFSRSRPQWNLILHERSLVDSMPDSLLKQPIAGIISRAETKAQFELIQQLNVPTIDLRGKYSFINGATIVTNETQLNIMALQYFQELGLRHVAGCGYVQSDWSIRRLKNLPLLSSQFGMEFLHPLVIPNLNQSSYIDDGIQPELNTPEIEALGENEIEQLSQWLLSLPKPIGILCASDSRGRQLIKAARFANLSVPEEISILGIDDDELICEFTSPQLSSIIPDTYRAGFEAASLLDRMLFGDEVPTRQLEIAPKGIHKRDSTGLVRAMDEEVRIALRLIRQSGREAIHVEKLAQQLHISRSTLERKFRKHLGHSPKMEIENHRIGLAQQLLRTTDLPIEKIAYNIGFEERSNFIRCFRRVVGMTPSAYRNRENQRQKF
jgi:LacI family transcriptional regulator